MKFAAIADVHGNIAALEAVLADIAALGIGECEAFRIASPAAAGGKMLRTEPHSGNTWPASQATVRKARVLYGEVARHGR